MEKMATVNTSIPGVHTARHAMGVDLGICLDQGFNCSNFFVKWIFVLVEFN